MVSLPTLHSFDHVLLKFICQYPGIRYRQLLRITNSTNGMLSYHLDELETQEFLVADRKRRTTRYYPTNLSAEVSKVIGHARNKVSRQILLLLVDKDVCSTSEITIFVGRAQSTVSWYLQRLVKDKILIIKPVLGQGKFKNYELLDKGLVRSVLSKYNDGSLDIMNNYTEITEDLV